MRLLLLFGGKSSEHDVSVRSAAWVLSRLTKMQRKVVTVGVGQDGSLWLYTGASPLACGVWQTGCQRLSLCYTGVEAPYLVLAQTGERLYFDAVFSLLHGGTGENGALQGMLDILGVPYIGSGVLSSAIGMHKPTAKQLAAAVGIPVLPHCLVSVDDVLPPLLAQTVKRVEQKLPYPVFVKPTEGGSSIGACPADCSEALAGALVRAADVGDAMVEPMVSLCEVSVALWETEDGLMASEVGQISVAGDFFDYTAKYLTEGEHLLLPARLPSKMREDMACVAKRLFVLFGCRHMARMDFFAGENGEFYFNEVNTLPGFTADSLFPKLLAAAGEDGVRAVLSCLDRHL